MNNNTAYCDMEKLGTFFNNKPLYKCKYCGLTVGLEDPNTKIMCFKKMEDITNMIHQAHTQDPNINKPQHLSGDNNLSDILLENIKSDTQKKLENDKQYESEENLCSEEEIDQRLAICKTCEYFQNNSCLLCGCTVIREANHKNKLAHKNQKCPADKWGIIQN